MKIENQTILSEENIYIKVSCPILHATKKEYEGLQTKFKGWIKHLLDFLVLSRKKSKWLKSRKGIDLIFSHQRSHTLFAVTTGLCPRPTSGEDF